MTSKIWRYYGNCIHALSAAGREERGREIEREGGGERRKREREGEREKKERDETKRGGTKR